MDSKAKTQISAAIDSGTIRCEAMQWEEQNVIFLRFPFEPMLNAQAKQLPGVKWSNRQKSWYVIDNNHYRQLFGMPFNDSSKNALTRIADINQPAFERFIETIRLKGYSPNTENTYRNEFAQLLQLLGNVHVDTLDPERIRSYMLYCTTELKLSEAHLHSRLNAIQPVGFHQ
jgi:hypothetical protein